MDISYDDEDAKRCYKCDQTVINNLNIVCNASNNKIVLWNQFQVFVYEDLKLETAVITLSPKFQIYNVLLSGNCLICLDCTGNTHTTFLKLKTAVPKSFVCSFQARQLGIVASTLYEEDHALCLKYEAKTYFICLHKVNADFSLIKTVILIYEEHLPRIQTQDKYIVKVHSLSAYEVESLKIIFKAEDLNVRNKYSLILVTFDRLNIFGCLFSSKMIEEQVSLVKLYSCPTEISDIQIIDAEEINIMIGLNIGTIIRLPFKDLISPQIIHLNTAINKFLAYKNTMIYTDGKSMWKAENIMSNDIKFSQFFVKHVKDFVKFEDQIICTTFMNLIYKFSIDDTRSYLKQETDEYCPADKVLNNSEYLQKILEEVKNNDAIIKMLSKEKDYITALSLSNRQDIMDSIISNKVIVYESFEDAISENSKTILTDHFSKYFDKTSFFFLIKICTTTEHKLGDILSNSIGDLRIHITLATTTKLLRTTSIKVTELKKISFLIPLQTKELDVTEMNVNIKIMSNIPGAFDTKRKVWTILYRKHVTLHSEHFIKFNLNLNKQQCFKNLEEPLENLILQSAENQYGNLFSFDDALKYKSAAKEWQMYVKLPDKYQELFKNKELTKHSTSKKVNYFLQQFTSEDFLKSKSNLTYTIGNEKVKIEIYNDSFSKPLLKLSSRNMKIVLNIRNFLSDLIYFVFFNYAPGKEFINLSSYATVENLQKAVRKCITESSEEDIEPLIEQFERNVIGVLPI